MPLVTATFSTGGAVVIDEAFELVAIEELTLTLDVLIAQLGLSTVPGTLLAANAVSAASLNDISSLMSSMLEQQKLINQNLGIITSALTGVSTNIGNGVTTAQLSYLDQAKNNQFNQQTTNDALARAELPPTEVKEGDLQKKVVSTFGDIANFQLQSQVALGTQAGLSYVQGQITSGTTWLMSTAWTTVGGPTLVAKIKKLFGMADPNKAKTTLAEANAVVRNKLTGVPQAELPPEV